MTETSTFLSSLVLTSYNRHDLPSRQRLWIEAAVIFCLVLAVGMVVYATGGLKYVYSHMMYIPVALAGLRFGFAGGVIAGMVAGLVLGPFMPLVVETGQPQETHAWLYRMFFMSLMGGLVGVFMRLESTERGILHEMVEGLSRTCARTLRSFAWAIAAKDQQTLGHCERVGFNAQVIGRHLNLAMNGVTELFWAGLLHDLGKLGVPDSILLKKGPLDNEEFAVIRKHAGFGDDMLKSISPAFQRIAEGMRSHHERWDGKGYPDGLKGRDIPLFGRILAVADVYEALTVERPYRRPMPKEQAVDYVRQGSGTMFDPKVVEAFLRAHENGKVCTATDDDCILYQFPDEMELDFVYRGYLSRNAGLAQMVMRHGTAETPGKEREGGRAGTKPQTKAQASGKPGSRGKGKAKPAKKARGKTPDPPRSEPPRMVRGGHPGQEGRDQARAGERR